MAVIGRDAALLLRPQINSVSLSLCVVSLLLGCTSPPAGATGTGLVLAALRPLMSQQHGGGSAAGAWSSITHSLDSRRGSGGGLYVLLYVFITFNRFNFKPAAKERVCTVI